MNHTEQPDLTGEQQREHEAQEGGIMARTVLDLDTDDEKLESGDETGEADDGDDEVIEDPDDLPVQADV